MSFKFTKRAFHFTIFSVILMTVFLVLSTVERTASNSGMNDVTGYLITLFFVTVLIGFILSMISLKEPNSLKKVVAMIVNVGLFLLLCYTLFQNLADVKSVFD